MSEGRRALAGLLAAAVTAGAQPAAVSVTPAVAAPVTPPEHRRGAEQTFLTFPEWFLVYSPAEYAAFVKHSPPSEFPFFGHLQQFWSSYRTVHDATRREYPVNFEYHVMIVVIGVSTTVEYALRFVYEKLFGRVTELAVPYGTTDEDRLAAWVAQDYVDFIHDRPWYEYDFVDKLGRLWKDTPLFGSGLLRKWERRYALTTEYLAKAGYAWLLMRGSQAAYGMVAPVTVVHLDLLPRGIEGELPHLAVLDRFSDGSVLVSLPRYDDFKDHAAALATRGASFREIAGNRTLILVSALVPATWSPPARELSVLFGQPVLTQPGRKRVVLVVPVSSLAETLRGFRRGGHELEHVYDY